MAINGISEAEAKIRVVKGIATTEEKGQYIAKFGGSKVAEWESIDGTQYEIDKVDYESAKDAGKAATQKSIGYDGHKSGAAYGDAALSAGTAIAASGLGAKVAGAIAGKAAGKAAATGAETLTTEGLKVQSEKAGNISDIATVTMAAAVVAKYLAQKPNKEQYEALMKTQQSEFPQGNSALEDAKSEMEKATEEATEKAEEAEEKNEAANQEIEEEKAGYDFMKVEMEALQEKTRRGAKLTQGEKSVMAELAPEMQKSGENIETIQKDTGKEVEDINEEIGDKIEVYDNAAETIGEVDGLAEMTEEYDENTKGMCYLEAAAQGINGVSAAVAAGKLTAKAIVPGQHWLFVPAAVGAYASYKSLKDFMPEQLRMAKDISGEIDERRDLQDNITQKYEDYETNLDTFEGNQETVEELELDIPEDLEEMTAQQVTPAVGAQNPDPLASAAAGKKEDDNKNSTSPLTAGLNNDDNTAKAPAQKNTKVNKTDDNQPKAEDGDKDNKTKKKEDK